MSNPEPGIASFSGCITRLFWMVGGIIILVFLSRTIITHRSLSVSDLGYWFVISALVLSRYVDIRYLRGQTAEGEPATLAHWKRYTLGLIPIALAAWLALHGVGFFLNH